MSTNRIVRIAVGLALIGYGVYSGNAWFYLGVLPLITGIVNWCPLEMKMGTCDPASGCCVTPASNDTNESCCAAPAAKPESAAKKAEQFSFAAPKRGIIEVLGTGCKRCAQLEAAAREAVEEMGSDYKVVKVEDVQTIANYRVTSTPALVVDGVVKSTGRVLKPEDIQKLIA